MTRLHIANETQMEALGAKLARQVGFPAVICLEGELGAGKTTLVRGYLRELGHHGPVKSPTYTLVEPYCINGRSIYHFDLYRLSSFVELEEMGFADYFDGQSCCLIEWPSRAQGYLPPHPKYCTIEITPNGRDVVLENL